MALLGLIIIVCLIVVAIFGPIFSSHTYDEQNLMMTNSSPSWEHWFGTDNLGRDIFYSRFIWCENFFSYWYSGEFIKSFYWCNLWRNSRFFLVARLTA